MLCALPVLLTCRRFAHRFEARASGVGHVMYDHTATYRRGVTMLRGALSAARAVVGVLRCEGAAIMAGSGDSLLLQRALTPGDALLHEQNTMEGAFPTDVEQAQRSLAAKLRE